MVVVTIRSTFKGMRLLFTAATIIAGSFKIIIIAAIIMNITAVAKS